MTTINHFSKKEDVHEFYLDGIFKYKKASVEDDLSIDTSLYIEDGSVNVQMYNLVRIANGLINVPWTKEDIKSVIELDSEWSDIELIDRISLLKRLSPDVCAFIVKEADKIDYPNHDLKKK